jgi:hypothetical protein
LDAAEVMTHLVSYGDQIDVGLVRLHAEMQETQFLAVCSSAWKIQEHQRFFFVLLSSHIVVCCDPKVSRVETNSQLIGVNILREDQKQ